MELNIIIAIAAFVCGLGIGVFSLRNRLANLTKQLGEKENELTRAHTKLESYTGLSEIFEKIADNTINKTHESLIQKNQIALEPFKNELNEFKKKVEKLNEDGIKNTTEIKTQIETLTKDSHALKFKAEELTEALRVNSKGRGMFGEIVLEQILSSSGLINKNDDKEKGNYVTQTGFRDLDDPGAKSNIPDAVVYFPEGQKNIIIDSKCPLNHFQEYVNETVEELKDAHIKNFYGALNYMVDDLSEKYNNLDGLNTPDFKLLFIPVEAAYLYAFENKNLILDANKKNILIVGPSTLLAILKVIREAWTTKNMSDNAQEVQNHARTLYEKFCVFLSKMEGLESKFNSLNTGFQDVFTTIKGRGGLIGQFENFKQLGINPSKQIDTKYLSTSDELIEAL